ncbi:hypothetical protein D3C81_1879300 [compost metagenome]
MNQMREHDALIDRVHDIGHVMVPAQANQPARQIATEVGAEQIGQECDVAWLLAAFLYPTVELRITLMIVVAKLP